MSSSTLKVTTIQNEDGITPVEIIGGVRTGDIIATTLNGMDVGTTDWTDYFGDSTIVGWVDTIGISVPDGWIKVLKLGITVHVAFYINGTSNSDLMTFTIPHSPTPGYSVRTVALGQDNSNYSANPAFVVLDEQTNLVKIYKDWASSGWTASGVKSIIGNFSFITS